MTLKEKLDAWFNLQLPACVIALSQNGEERNCISTEMKVIVGKSRRPCAAYCVPLDFSQIDPVYLEDYAEWETRVEDSKEFNERLKEMRKRYDS